MSELLIGGLLIQIFAPFLVTCIFTLIGFFVGRAHGRRQGYDAGWYDCTNFQSTKDLEKGSEE